jgi:hypothetical protein
VVGVLPGVQQVVVVDILSVGDIRTLYTQSSGSWVKKMSKGDHNLMRGAHRAMLTRQRCGYTGCSTHQGTVQNVLSSPTTISTARCLRNYKRLTHYAHTCT